MTTIKESSIGNVRGPVSIGDFLVNGPLIYFGTGNAVLRNVTLSADPSLLSDSVCARTVLMSALPTWNGNTSGPEILLGDRASVTTNESSTLACSVRAEPASGLHNYLIYTASTNFKPAGSVNFGSDQRAVSQTEVCASRKLCKAQSHVPGELNYTACNDGWTRVLEDGGFCLKDICVIGLDACSSANTEGEWRCVDGSKRSFDRKSRKFCTPAGDKTKTTEKIAMAITAGTVVAFCVALLIYLVRKDKERAKKILARIMPAPYPAQTSGTPPLSPHTLRILPCTAHTSCMHICASTTQIVL